MPVSANKRVVSILVDRAVKETLHDISQVTGYSQSKIARNLIYSSLLQREIINSSDITLKENVITQTFESILDYYKQHQPSEN